MPHDHSHVIARVHMATKANVEEAIQASLDAHDMWSTMPWEARAAIFLKASELLRGKYRAQINASTMLNQSKTCHQAEIDSACELIDFWRFNTDLCREIYEDMQPPCFTFKHVELQRSSPFGRFHLLRNAVQLLQHRRKPAIKHAIMGNTGVWKPSRNSYVSNYLLDALMMDAGLPAGVINFIPGKASMVGDTVLAHPMLAGIHFTGSTSVFRKMWRDVANNFETIAPTLVWLEKQVERTSLSHIQIVTRLH